MREWPRAARRAWRLIDRLAIPLILLAIAGTIGAAIIYGKERLAEQCESSPSFRC